MEGLVDDDIHFQSDFFHRLEVEKESTKLADDWLNGPELRDGKTYCRPSHRRNIPNTDQTSQSPNFLTLRRTARDVSRHQNMSSIFAPERFEAYPRESLDIKYAELQGIPSPFI